MFQMIYLLQKTPEKLGGGESVDCLNTQSIVEVRDMM